MPVSGLIALLDDIASIADDVATLAGAAAKKTSGIVTDDMAVTAEQAIGIRREREIPVVLAVARGSMFNKGVILVPGALALNAVAPWAITPILMAGGTYLCFEGVEKVIHAFGHGADDAPQDASSVTDPEAFEKLRIAGAIRTDLILSAEIVAISLGQVSSAPFLTQVLALYAVAIVMTVGVYGMVGVLVKVDDFGEWLVRSRGPRVAIGKLIVASAPKLLRAISVIGTVAMLMVGGQIFLHGIAPAYAWVHHVVEALPSGVRGVAMLLADILVGVLVGLVVVGIGATGLPSRLWALVPKRKA